MVTSLLLALFLPGMVVNSTTVTVFPLELSSLNPVEQYTAITQLRVGQPGVIISETVHNLTHDPLSVTMVIEDISESNVTDSIQLANVTVNALNETGFGVPWVIKSPGNHTLISLALTPDRLPSLLAERMTTNAMVEPRQQTHSVGHSGRV